MSIPSTVGHSESGVGITPSFVSTPVDPVVVPSEADWSSPTEIISNLSGGWDDRLVGKNSIIRVGNTYHLYYIGADGDRVSDGGPAHRAVGLATADATLSDANIRNASNWTKHPSNPIIPWSDIQNNGNEEEGAWAVAGYVDGGDVLLYIADLVGGGGSVSGDIRLYTSTDGVNLTDQGIVINHTDSNFDGDDEIKPLGVYEDPSETWHMYYIAKGADVTNWSLAHAVGTARDTWTSGEVIRVARDGASGLAHRHGGDVVVLQDDGVDLNIGFTVAYSGSAGPDYYRVNHSDFTAEIRDQQYAFNTEQSGHYLDRDEGRWLLVVGGPSDDVDGLDIRTATMTLA